MAADRVHHVVRSRAGRFVNQDARHPVDRMSASGRLVKGVADRGEHPALDGRRLAGHSRARGGGVSAAAEWSRISLTFTLACLERRLMRVSSGSISSKTQATTTGSMARIWSISPSVSSGYAPVRA